MLDNIVCARERSVLHEITEISTNRIRPQLATVGERENISRLADKTTRK